MAYAVRADVEMEFGITNVKKWADNENLADDAYIAARVTAKLTEAEAYINSRLLDGPYPIPFTPVPDLIKAYTAKYAGFLLYTSRGVRDGNPDNNELIYVQKEVNEFIAQVKRGLIRFPVSEQPDTRTYYPAVVSLDD